MSIRPAGNLTHDVNGHAYVYDGENKQTTYEAAHRPTGERLIPMTAMAGE